ncbi:Hypothetical predicted protein [Mytilus galloprovincialis]|uniref:DUF6570 domain-containing protein n=1 Tax=Mytilus galloprovincialis TaxID=29158 RepID=A0A8B6H3Z0_MYTGA|nr:Hypothetical predicted protein [Mytilus galloprovincialis]
MQTFYQHSVYACSKEHYMQKGIPQEILDQTLTGTKSVSESEWVCKTCHKYIMEKKMPPTAYNNGFKYNTLPDYLHHLSPTQTEERTVALRIPFMQLKELGVGKQFGIYGNTVNVPMDPSDVISVLPRRFEDTATIHLLFKRKLEYKSSILHETVRPKVIYELVKYFIGNSPLYQEEAIQLDTSWTSENTNIINFASETDIEVIENHEKISANAKLQTLQVKDITTTALRKTNNNSYTTGQLKTSENINSLLQNDQGFTFLKTLRSSPPYYQNKQKELFAILRQLGLPTFFATFSAAETQWLDLLCILAKKEYKRDIFVEETIAMNWMQREEDRQFVKLQKHRHSKSCKKKGKRVCRFGFPIPPMAETLILEPFPADHSKTEILKKKGNYKKISIVLETLTGDEDMTFQTFLTKCKLNNQQYIDAIRS